MEITDDSWKTDYALKRIVPGQGLCGLRTQMYTCGLFVDLEPLGYAGRYCYERTEDAADALMQWSGQGDPPGPWIKYKGIGGERLGPGAGDGHV